MMSPSSRHSWPSSRTGVPRFGKVTSVPPRRCRPLPDAARLRREAAPWQGRPSHVYSVRVKTPPHPRTLWVRVLSPGWGLLHELIQDRRTANSVTQLLSGFRLQAPMVPAGVDSHKSDLHPVSRYETRNSSRRRDAHDFI